MSIEHVVLVQKHDEIFEGLERAVDLWIRRSFKRAVDASEVPDLAVSSFFVETLGIPSLADGKRRRDEYLVESGKIKFIPSKG